MYDQIKNNKWYAHHKQYLFDESRKEEAKDKEKGAIYNVKTKLGTSAFKPFDTMILLILTYAVEFRDMSPRTKLSWFTTGFTTTF